jgi:hypothetical protein
MLTARKPSDGVVLLHLTAIDNCWAETTAVDCGAIKRSRCSTACQPTEAGQYHCLHPLQRAHLCDRRVCCLHKRRCSRLQWGLAPAAAIAAAAPAAAAVDTIVTAAAAGPAWSGAAPERHAVNSSIHSPNAVAAKVVRQHTRSCHPENTTVWALTGSRGEGRMLARCLQIPRRRCRRGPHCRRRRRHRCLMPLWRCPTHWAALLQAAGRLASASAAPRRLPGAPRQRRSRRPEDDMCHLMA